MIKNAQWIIAQGESLIKPFVPDKVKKITSVNEGGNTYVLSMPVDAISFGVSGFGYDLRLSPKQFKVFRHIPGQIINPKKFNPSFLYDAELNHSLDGDYFILPHHSYALGVSLEYINIPDNIEVIFTGFTSSIGTLAPGIFNQLFAVLNFRYKRFGNGNESNIHCTNSTPC